VLPLYLVKFDCSTVELFCVCFFSVCRLFFKDMQHKALEKKSNIEYLEQIGWQQFLPKFVIEGIPVCVSLTITGSGDVWL